MERFLNENGKKLIGWDEILEGGLAPNAAVMSWRGEDGGIAAARERHYVVMTPGEYCYLDHYQADPKTEPLAIGGYLPLKKLYGYEPIPAILSKEEAKYVLGAQGNVWTEYMQTPAQVEYMVFPRAAALAEVVWSPKGARDFDGFKTRLSRLSKFYDLMGINYCKTEFKQ
jgi:hexosaminidase